MVSVLASSAGDLRF